MLNNGAVFLNVEFLKTVFCECVELCKEKAVELVQVETMHELGKACGIHVKAAAAAII